MTYLKIILGCMFSSKTTTLLSEINRYKHITNKILVINHILDKQRQSRSDYIIESHDNKYSSAIMIKELNELNSSALYKDAEIIIIDEGQFFTDLYKFIRHELFTTTNKKMFIVAGLANDYNMEPIGDIIKLIPMADEILKLYAYCIYCKDGTLASFTRKLTNDNNQITIGKNETYAPCCRKHFLKNKIN